ncbi:transcription termination/antitermination protein NusG ['Opuntia sp.' phytoplasma]|uniref:Transcription termination/antitermination protein NusG n=1 Tax=Candidatus Phytoplasma asiaticum TaxID=2763338 RepID=A0AAX3B9F3_9MOLU|nr:MULTISPECIES: transcription termination/antitermination protein NusG [Phytoplasma]MDO8053857.1 transcription termination/antitermination protein NusG ['Opuntia sp.' phytoplasma]MDO8057723.1 transcription termination/antitermination protein NusG ['Opuntia sp.' phytoplasma]UQV27311.1 transcription termination/antitermination protein NusG ['Parthenium hysterophorus' phyllody phytoplasma]
MQSKMKNNKIIDNDVTDEDNNLLKSQWYILQTQSGYEKVVQQDLLKIANSGIGISNLIHEVICPTEKHIKIKADGTKKEIEKKIYIGYIFIKMIMTNQSWFIVRNIPKVTGFLGSIKKEKGSKPIPLTESEINPILLKMGIISKPNYDHLINKRVQIINGSFVGQVGRVSLVDYEKDKMMVEIELFGRATPIEISFSSFKEIN